MSRLTFDIESNGFIEKMTMVHCIVTEDIDTGEVREYTSAANNLEEGLRVLTEADELVGHNIIDFDIPAIQKIYPRFKPAGKLTDTLILSRLTYAHLRERDYALDVLPQKLRGSHGLEAWGHRLGFHKGDYMAEMKAAGLDPWAAFNQKMLDYCVNDVALNVKLYKMLQMTGFSQKSFDLEHAVHIMCKATTAHGVSFNEKGAYELYAELSAERMDLEEKLKEVFGSWWEHEAFVPKRSNKTIGYLEGVPLNKVTVVEFNPSSRYHIAKRLTDLHGWKPTKFTPGGQPQIDEDVLKHLKYPEAALVSRYLMLQKRIGQIAEGKEAWLKLVKNGRIHGRINTNGAVTGRATHSRPNTAQVPAVRAEYGGACRALFRATPGMVLVGADASGLELRLLAHYLSHYDGGEYTRTVLHGDVHTANQKAAGLPNRDDAKTFIYALLYGAGDFKIGTIVGKGAGAGRVLRSKFMKAIPAYAALVKGVKKAAKKRRRIRSLDGRYIHVRSEHAALNTLLQGAGAVIMKQAMVNYHAILERNNIPFAQVLFVHDEFQVECLPEHAEAVGQAMVEGIRMTTEQFNLGCPMDGEYKVGENWAETH